jgi:hypothetical protein
MVLYCKSLVPARKAPTAIIASEANVSIETLKYQESNTDSNKFKSDPYFSLKKYQSPATVAKFVKFLKTVTIGTLT